LVITSAGITTMTDY